MTHGLMRIAYFINQYPKVSHSFIRREILALEQQGVAVSRFAIRGWDDKVLDPDDLSEQQKTQYVLQTGLVPLARAALGCLVRRPAGFVGALRAAWTCSRQSDRSLAYHLIYLAEACWLLDRLSAARVRHVHAHFGTNSAEVVMLARLLGGPSYSFTVHGPEEFDKPQGLHLQEKMAQAAFTVAISSFGRSQLFRWVGHAHWPRVHVVHCGLDRAFHQGHEAPVPDVPRLVCVGRICEQKGQLLLVQALAEVVRRGHDCELVLAGDGDMRPQVESLVRAYGLERRVSITGWIDSARVRHELLQARAMVLPSFAEGLPVVIMEALALGRPVLTTTIAGIPELVRGGENGWLVPAGDVSALAEAMAAVLQTPVEQLTRMGQAGRERVLQQHDVDTEARKLKALFVGVQA